MSGYTRQQYWEFAIIVTILLIVLYRFALVYDYIPDEYRPGAIFSDVYKEAKKGLTIEAREDTTLGHMSKAVLERLNTIEQDIRASEERSAREELMAESCHENSIFRFFMHIGEDTGKCSEQNLRVKSAIGEITNATDRKTGGTVKSATPPNNPNQPPTNKNPAPTYVPAPVEPASTVVPVPVAPEPSRPNREPVSVSEPQ